MRSRFKLLLLFAPMLMILHVISQARADQKFPSIWRRTMTNDPSTNYALDKYSEPLIDQAEEAGRILTLVRLLGAGCDKAEVNKGALSHLLENSGFANLKKLKLREVSDKVSAKFDGFDYETLAHLCSGVDFLFGKKGVLGRSLMVAGTGEPSLPYEPANPYLRVPPLQPESP